MQKAAREAEEKYMKGEEPPILSEKGLEGISKPAWMEQDPFVKYENDLPSAKSVAMATTAISLCGGFLLYRWNRHAGRIVDRHLREILLLSVKNVLKIENHFDTGMGKEETIAPSTVYGTVLSTTTFIAAGSWTAHYLEVKNTHEFAERMKGLLRGKREQMEEQSKWLKMEPTNQNEEISGGPADGIGQNSGDIANNDENDIQEGFDPLIALFGKELMESSAENEEGNRGGKSTGKVGENDK
eukprot:jgi/Bigna1/86442/estExt_fgenesh1_pg.C_100255